MPFALLLLLAACAQAPPRPGPTAPSALPPTALPRNAPDVDQIQDAVPRSEPRSAFGNPPFYSVNGRRYAVLASAQGYSERGVASWYGLEFHGLRTSTGEPYDMFAMTAAHKTLPLPCYARVTNLSNGRSVIVRINDRGPFVANRIIDLSYTAAVKLDMIRNGTAFVQVEVLTAATPPLIASLPPAVPASSPPPTPAPTPAAPASPPTPPTPAPSPAAPAAATAAPSHSGDFYIQVGAYANVQNARRVVQRLRDAGLTPSFTIVTDSRQLQRVRLGPVVSVQQFDALIARLNALGYPDARLAQD